MSYYKSFKPEQIKDMVAQLNSYGYELRETCYHTDGLVGFAPPDEETRKWHAEFLTDEHSVTQEWNFSKDDGDDITFRINVTTLDQGSGTYPVFELAIIDTDLHTCLNKNPGFMGPVPQLSICSITEDYLHMLPSYEAALKQIALNAIGRFKMMHIKLDQVEPEPLS